MRTLFRIVAALLVVVGSGTLTSRASADEHFALIKSVPADEVTLQTPPTSISLLFSEAPDLAGTRIRLVYSHDELVETGKVMRDAEDETWSTRPSRVTSRTGAIGSCGGVWPGTVTC